MVGSAYLQQPLCQYNLRGQMLYSWPEEDRVRDCAVSPDGHYLVVASTSRTLYVYNLTKRQKLHQVTFESELTCVSIDRHSKYILLNRGTQVALIDIETAEIAKKYSHDSNTNRRYIFRSRFGGADDRFVITGSEGAFSFFFSLHIRKTSV